MIGQPKPLKIQMLKFCLYMGGKVEQMRDETNDRRTQTLRPDDANKYTENGNETLAQTREIL